MILIAGSINNLQFRQFFNRYAVIPRVPYIEGAGAPISNRIDNPIAVVFPFDEPALP